MARQTRRRCVIAAARWGAVRAVAEGGATPGNLAAALGCSEATVRRRANGEGWVWRSRNADEVSAPQGAVGAADEGFVEPRPGEDPMSMMARCAAHVTRQVGALVSRAEAGEQIQKTEIEALVALMRMMERWEVLATERSQQEKEELGDEELAAILGRINDRIIELAEGLAGQLVAARADARPAEAAS